MERTQSNGIHAIGTLTDRQLESIQRIIAYKFTDRRYLEEALQPPTSPTDTSPSSDACRRLAMVGKHTLEQILLLILYGDMDIPAENIQAHVAENMRQIDLASFGFSLRLDQFILPTSTNPAQEVSDEQMAEVVLALIGATYIDCQMSLSGIVYFVYDMGILTDEEVLGLAVDIEL